ncbi:MAG TPA: low affinity iron permease family protein [Rhodothermales bacterium]|nr:low affinity iron permease family protein [Rhodothermales bacterium]
MSSRKSLFGRFAAWTAMHTGRPSAFLIACAVVVVWGLTGPLFGFSDTWQLVINTGTTIVTFLMVFLIQNSQNRDSRALQIKLDELIRATKGAHNSLLDLEELEDHEIAAFLQDYEALAERARQSGEDTDTPPVKG